MLFPPPVRYYLPILVFVFGFATVWFDYELNLKNDLARNFKDVVANMDAAGERMARRSARQLEHGIPATLADDLATWVHQPWLKEAALVDENAVVIDDWEKRWVGQMVRATPMAPAMDLMVSSGEEAHQIQNHYESNALVYGAYSFLADTGRTNWALVVFDRSDAVRQAKVDARSQSGWLALAITVFSLCLWASLHFGFAARLARLAQAVRDFGDGRTKALAPMPGGDELHELSVAFAVMGTRLAEREAERVRLERVILDTSEREQRRIGADLHDGLGQQLTAASLITNGLITELGSAAPALVPQAETLGRQLRETIAEVRSLSHGLAPVTLAEDGLTHALHELAEATTRSSGVRCIFDCPQPVSPSDVVAAGHLYRIAQEAANNALKHAKAKEIRIGLERRGEMLVLEVEDDGEGLPETSTAAGGLGLRMMRHRAKLIGGTLEIGSSPAGGTRIACSIPTTP